MVSKMFQTTMNCIDVAGRMSRMLLFRVQARELYQSYSQGSKTGNHCLASEIITAMFLSNCLHPCSFRGQHGNAWISKPTGEVNKQLAIISHRLFLPSEIFCLTLPEFQILFQRFIVIADGYAEKKFMLKKNSCNEKTLTTAKCSLRSIIIYFINKCHNFEI